MKGLNFVAETYTKGIMKKFVSLLGIVLMLVFGTLCQYVNAQDKPLLSFSTSETNYVVYGQVLDFITRSPLEGVKAQILTKDSTLLFEYVTNWQSNIFDTKLPFILLVLKAGDYVLRFSKDGYESKTVDYHVAKFRKSEPTMFHKPVLLKRLPREVTLNEVTVKATKVKFYVRGDTLVYNADAFQLEEGSMLDALIRQLPGAELKDDGRILVNGRQVESLLLNGEDFFKKDRTIMLENLPTYMVKNVQVYDKQGRTSQLLGKSIGDEQLVMDVKLKKQYEIGWLGNAEAGGGTHDRYLARIFALRYTGHSRLSAFGGVNNLNDRQRPGVSSEWMPSVTDDLSTMRNAGFDYLINDRRQRFKLEGDATVSHTDTHGEQRTASESNLLQGDTYGRSHLTSYGHNLSVSSRHDLTFNTEWVKLLLQPSFSYNKTHGKKTSLALTADSDAVTSQFLDSLFLFPSERAAQMAHLTNLTSLGDKNDGHNLSAALSMQASIKLPHSIDKLLVETHGDYANNGHHDYAHKLYDYPKDAASTDLRNEYGKNSLESHSLSAKLTYVWWGLGDNWSVMPSYEYAAERTTQNDRLYRLDYLWQDESAWPELGDLPSVEDWMSETFDPQHSVWARQKESRHVIAVKMHKEEYQNNRWRFDFNFPLSIDRRHLDYNRPALVDTAITKHYLFFRPSATANHVWLRQAEDGSVWQSHEMSVGYEMGINPPRMSYFVNVLSDNNPLQVYTGNGSLHATTRHKWWADYKWSFPSRQRIFSARMEYQFMRKALALAYTYNRRTGAYTYRPENVNGNYTLTGQLNYSTPLDKAKHLTVDLNTNVSHQHNADLMREQADVAFQKSEVGTTYLTQSLRLNYSIGHVRIGGKSSVTYTHQSSSRTGFQTTDASDFSYGLTLVADMPLGLQMSTDATMYSRRGYSDHAMNDDNFVWNMRLSKKLLKGRLAIMLDGFDILGNISNVRRTINAQGHQETWYLSIPRYALLHAVYRLNMKPKKKR